MIREVDFVDYYLPPFMQAYKEPVAALDAEQPEFQLVWKAADRMLYNHFISTADEYGISRFEKILGISPSSDDTLESRRSRVQSRWFTMLPYTLKILVDKLHMFCRDTDFSLHYQFDIGYDLYVQTALELFGQVEELEKMLDGIVPCSIVLETRNEISSQVQGEFYLHGGVSFTQEINIISKERGSNGDIQ